MTQEKGVAYILGILSIVFAFFLPLAGIILAIIGLVQNKKEKSKRAKKLNIIGLVLAVVVFIATLALNIYLAINTAQGGFPTY
jgi:hypothetical protein